MIGLDTNVVVRLITNDDKAQSDAAHAFVARKCSAEDPGYINREVVLEMVWVLEGAFGYARNDIAAAVDMLLTVSELEVEDGDRVREALRAYASGADFADMMIALTNDAHGCTTTATFDRKAAKGIEHFTLVPGR